MIGADKLWGADARDRRQRDEDRDHRRRPRRAPPLLRPAGFSYPPGFPKGPDEATTPKVIVQRTFAPGSPATASTRRSPFDPEKGRSTPRTSPGSPPATTAPQAGNAPPLGRRAERVPRQLQGADDPDAGLRPRRQLGRDRRGDRGGRRRRDGRDQPLARRARGRAVARHRRHGDRGCRDGRRRAGDRGRQRLRRVRLRLGQLAGERARAITVAATTDDRDDRRLLVGRADAGLAAAEARRQRAGRRDHLVAARPTRAARGARSTARAWRRRTSRAASRS